MVKYLDEKLIQEIKDVFESRYNRNLSLGEVIEIAENLSVVVEEICKFKWKQKYDKRNIQN